MNTAYLLNQFTLWAQCDTVGIQIPGSELLSTQSCYAAQGYSNLLCWTKPASPNKPLVQIFRLPEILEDPKINLIVMTQNAWTIGVHFENHGGELHATNLFSANTGPMTNYFTGQEEPDEHIINMVWEDLSKAGLFG